MSRDNDRDLSDDLNGPYVQAACVDCGADVVTDCDPDGALCDACDEKREQWAVQTEVRMAKAALKSLKESPASLKETPTVVDVAIEPVSETNGVVEVALIPKSEIAIILMDDPEGRALRRMATAVLAADLTTIKDVGELSVGRTGRQRTCRSAGRRTRWSAVTRFHLPLRATRSSSVRVMTCTYSPGRF